MRASSSSAAVEDSSARPGRPAASREAPSPRSAGSRARAHADDGLQVLAVHSVVARDLCAGRREPCSRGPSTSATRSASRASPSEPGGAVREVRASSLSELRAAGAVAERRAGVERVGAEPRRRRGRPVGERERGHEQRDQRRAGTRPGRPERRAPHLRYLEVSPTILGFRRSWQTEPPRILLVDDEQPIQTLLSFPLQRDGYEVVQASDGREALTRFSEQTFDLVVLDVMMPRMDGLEVCRRLRARSSVPIIMLTAKSEEIDKVLGLELGADDYITKPFSMREFRSRVKAALRRAGHGRGRRGRRAADRGARPADRPGQAHRDARGETVATTFVEFEILTALARSPGPRVHARHAARARLGRLRLSRPAHDRRPHPPPAREDRADAKEPEYIFTVRGVGYRFRDGGVACRAHRCGRCATGLRWSSA